MTYTSYQPYVLRFSNDRSFWLIKILVIPNPIDSLTENRHNSNISKGEKGYRSGYNFVDMNAYIKRITSGLCFICEMLAGNPLEEQQFEALRLDKGILNLSETEMAALAVQISQRLANMS